VHWRGRPLLQRRETGIPLSFLRNIAHKAAEVLATWSSSDPKWYAQNGYMRMYEMLGGGTGTSSGISVNVKLAMTCPAVNICSRVVTESLAALPLALKSRKDGQTTDERKTPSYEVLAKKPNSYQTSLVFRKTFFHHAVNYGNGYARIVRRGDKPEGEAIGMHLLHPSATRREIEENGEAAYILRNRRGEEERLRDPFVFFLPSQSDDGITGVGAVEAGREEIAAALAIQRFGSAFFARGGVPAGMIVKETPFKTDPDRQKFKEDWSKEYEGQQGFFKKMLVEGGTWKFEKFGLSPVDSQLTDAAAAAVPSIARFWNLTPHLAGDLSRAHFANVEQLWIQFLRITLNPWIVGFEQEVYRSLLTQKERDAGLYAKHNVNAFMRGDFETRMKGYATLLQNGPFCIDDVLDLEDMDPLPNGEGKAHLVQLNMQDLRDVRANSAARAAKGGGGKDDV
jgi:HK97 family phage portal protein